MPNRKVVHEKIKDSVGDYDLRVRRIEGNERKSPAIHIRCGCGDPTHRLVISHNDLVGDPRADSLEIGSVIASVTQWRALLLPLLDLPYLPPS